MTKFLESLIHKLKLQSKPIFNALVVIFIASFVILLFIHLGRDPLFDWDEGIYAELGRELLEQGHWLTPHWNYQLWLEKPPGIAWLTALGMRLFGINEFGARLFMPILAGITLYFTYRIGLQLKNKYLGLTALLLLTNMNLFLSRARVVNTDVALLASITATVYLTMISASPLLVALAIALGVFFKGLAGFLSLIIVLPLLIKKSKKYLSLFTSYLLLLTIPWHLYQFIVNGDKFLTPYFKEQVLRRATVPIEFHLESRWYYFQYLYQNLGIGWLFLLILGIILITTQIFQAKGKRQEARGQITLAWWLFFPLALFTLAKTRLYWYILPIYPAIALIMAYFLETLASLTKLGRQILILFLSLYALTTYQNLLKIVDIHRSQSHLSPQLKLANFSRQLSHHRLLVLVPYHERVAEAILPQNQRISSSFRYGGAPSLVFYVQQPVFYFYNLDEFKSFLTPNDLVLLTKSDYQQLKLSSLSIIKASDDYLLVGYKNDNQK